ncbi:hypothetical protein HHK36_017689 [Tetracentron sinense]|uniref:non-specific serine/threonine protein kinase n=1 Tax=Tetracentron sinense TaxID=13715 RepID=A0A835DCU2_TETSI|nr:hypothetical protein HHK36_017689 [Tetracentron sinense]
MPRQIQPRLSTVRRTCIILAGLSGSAPYAPLRVLRQLGYAQFIPTWEPMHEDFIDFKGTSERMRREFASSWRLSRWREDENLEYCMTPQTVDGYDQWLILEDQASSMPIPVELPTPARPPRHGTIPIAATTRPWVDTFLHASMSIKAEEKEIAVAKARLAAKERKVKKYVHKVRHEVGRLMQEKIQAEHFAASLQKVVKHQARSKKGPSLARVVAEIEGAIDCDYDAETNLKNEASSDLIECCAANQREDWRHPYLEFLKTKKLPRDKKDAAKVQRKSQRFFLCNDDIFRRGLEDISLRCLAGDEIDMTLYEAHGGDCGSHHGKKKLRKGLTASFNSTFVLVIDPQTPPGGEGMAFILTRESSIPDNSEGKWLGIVNASTNGSSLRNIVAVEFDTRKSYEEDLDDKHVGVDLNSINSIKQVSMSDYGVNLSSGFDVTARIQYDGESITIFVSMNNGTGSNITNPVISIPLNLFDYLPEDIYMGSSASTGNGTQLNCVKSWHFNGVDIEDESSSDYGKHAMGQEDLDMEEEIEGSTLGSQKFRLKELKSATGNFHSKNQLGRGGFGMVYKGIMKEINMEIAVKRVSKDSRQGKKEFVAESPMAEAVILSWERRHNIICGVASALDYLHNGCEKRVLHCDVKSSNMMLDSEFNARSGDFGLARTVQHNGDTHHSTKEIAGTPGYMAPECFHTGIASLEADVYGFGVFTLEVACGRRPNNRKNQNTHNNFIVNWVWELYGKEGILDAVDLRLDDNLERSKRNVC